MPENKFIPEGAWMTLVEVEECDCSLNCRQYFTATYLWADGYRGRRFWMSKS